MSQVTFPAYIDHPDYGAHVVYNNPELRAHEARGWKLREEKPERAKPGPKPKPKE